MLSEDILKLEEQTLRPKYLKDYVGQDALKEMLK